MRASLYDLDLPKAPQECISTNLGINLNFLYNAVACPLC